MNMEYERADIQSEYVTKMERVQELIARFELDALVLRRASSFAWATCGANPSVNVASSEGGAFLVITPSKKFFITDSIESPRLTNEENLSEQGWELVVSPWYKKDENIDQLIQGERYGADCTFPGALNLSNELAWLRSQLTSSEVSRFITLSKLCAEGMQQTIDAIEPGMTEYQIAGLLSRAVESRGVQAIVNLVGTDERVYRYRHPLPTPKSLKNYAMLVLCGRKWGLVCSVSRLVHFGKLPQELMQKAEAVAFVDAQMIACTRPGKTLGEIFVSAQHAYAQKGFSGEWKNHHQGGLAGYEPREVTANPDMKHRVAPGQVYAWNPSIAGTKSEDTILVKTEGNEILTNIPGWPTIDIQVGNDIIKRPAILVKD